MVTIQFMPVFFPMNNGNGTIYFMTCISAVAKNIMVSLMFNDFTDPFVFFLPKTPKQTGRKKWKMVLPLELYYQS